MSVFVLAQDGTRLMPTNEARARQLLRSGDAKIESHRPFTIRLTRESTKYVQPIELSIDSGANHIGISMKSEAHEYISEERILLKNQKQRTDDRRMYRKHRLSRKRYRAPRFDNRTANQKPGWMAPSIKNKYDQHVMLVKRFCEVAPVKTVTIETGSFDMQMTDAVETGKPLPTGNDYHKGAMLGIQNTRIAVFERDHYTCRFCGRSAFTDKAKLYAHHALYWMGRHANRVDEMVTCCERCHTSDNHRPGGKLYGYTVPMTDLSGASFMNTVRRRLYFAIYDMLPDCDVYSTIGARTTVERKSRCLPKSHTNDAYSIGRLFPKHRARPVVYEKQRRNSRILEKFYDAKLIDIRTGRPTNGKELGTNRTKREVPRNNEKNSRKYRGPKLKSGYRSIRRERYDIRPYDTVLVGNEKKTVKSSSCLGTRVQFLDGVTLAVSKLKCCGHCGGWYRHGA